MRFALVLAILLLTSAGHAQPTAVTRAKRLTVKQPEEVGGWSSTVRYSALTDFADSRSPRSYVHTVAGSVGYAFDKNWSASVSLGARAETIDGQISKGREQSYGETLGPSTSLGIGFDDRISRQVAYGLYVEGEPLWDEPSRREGYKGLIGGGAKMNFSFFRKHWILGNDLSATELMNTYKYGSNLNANPSHFYTYRLSNVFKVYRGFRASYNFGAKLTEYTDGFTGYAYSNTVSLSYVWPKVSFSVAYDNGGFTDNGDISLWYVDQYRRLARAVVGYTF